MAHKGHPSCEHTSKAKCDRAIQEALGRCKALTAEGNECVKWATDASGLCAQHYESRVNAELKAGREASRMAEIGNRIEAFIAWTAEHPSVWDTMPSGGGTDGVAPA